MSIDLFSKVIVKLIIYLLLVYYFDEKKKEKRNGEWCSICQYQFILYLNMCIYLVVLYIDEFKLLLYSIFIEKRKFYSLNDF